MKLLTCLMLLTALPAAADSVTCHIIYGGENFTVIARPTSWLSCRVQVCLPVLVP